MLKQMLNLKKRTTARDPVVLFFVLLSEELLS